MFSSRPIQPTTNQGNMVRAEQERGSAEGLDVPTFTLGFSLNTSVLWPHQPHLDPPIFQIKPSIPWTYEPPTKSGSTHPHLALTPTHHIANELLQQVLQELLGGQQRRLVQLLLPQVVVIVHGL